MRILFLSIFVVSGLCGILFTGCTPRENTSQTTPHAALYHCPMHPTYTADKPGTCPICGMNLVRIPQNTAPSTSTATKSGYAPVRMNDAQVQMLNVKTIVMTERRIPITAVLFTGRRSVVYVQTEPGHFLPREIRTGREVEDSIEVLSGLKDGETIVTSANFLIDSESRIKGALQ